LATLHAKEVGAQRIIAKGLTVAHGRILEALGVERIVFPEIEIARSVADQMTWPNVLDYVPIDPEHSVVEMTVPDSIMGETLLEADLRKRFNIWVIGVKDVLTGKFHMLPGPDLRFNDNQLLVLMGKKDDLNRLREFK
jgi:trk system potassium uptake protein TrkA